MAFGHPRGGQGGSWAPWGPWSALGWPKTCKNARFLATPGAAKVAKGALGGHGPHWVGKKCVKTLGFWPPQERPRWIKGSLGPMAHAGVAKKVGKHEVFGHPRGGLVRLEAPKASQKCIIYRVFAAISPNSGIPKARLEALKKENKRCVYTCVCL